MRWIRLPSHRHHDPCGAFLPAPTPKPPPMETSLRPTESQEATRFAKCVHPLPVEDFLSRAWEKEVLHLARHDPTYFADLFTLKDLDAYLGAARQGPKTPPIHLANAHKKPTAKVYLPDGTVDVSGVNAAFRSGDTLILNGMRYSWRPVEDLCRSFEDVFQHEVGANLYLTPAKSQGFSAHFDTHEVFVLQLSGTKLWRIYHQEIEAPLVNQFHPLNLAELPPPAFELTLRPGDLLYMPRGRVHEALSTDSTSMHLSVGIHTTRWVDALHAAISRLAEKDVSYRRSLPAGILFAGAEAPAGVRDEFEALLQRLGTEVPVTDVFKAVREAILERRGPRL